MVNSLLRRSQNFGKQNFKQALLAVKCRTMLKTGQRFDGWCNCVQCEKRMPWDSSTDVIKCVDVVKYKIGSGQLKKNPPQWIAVRILRITLCWNGGCRWQKRSAFFRESAESKLGPQYLLAGVWLGNGILSLLLPPERPGKRLASSLAWHHRCPSHPEHVGGGRTSFWWLGQVLWRLFTARTGRQPGVVCVPAYCR